ncbi:MAG: OAM dimerization domain-containing protein [Desulfobacterales bacterium]
MSRSEWIRPYGDTRDDGMMQLSFSLPVEYGGKAKKAAELYVEKLNFEDVAVVHARKISDNYTFFVVYARAVPRLDYSLVEASEIDIEIMDFKQINRQIKEKIKRRINVVGATIGSDAHTVGIDAIMNMKGYNQDYGLERYPHIRAINMGAQVSPESLIKKAMNTKADAILVSQTVTQKEIHIRTFTALIELLEAERIRDRFIVIAGGPRISNEFAIELGYDAGFGPGTVPSQVASYILSQLLKSQKKEAK